MTDDRKARGAAGGFTGMFWFAGWLFTIAFTKLLWWQCILALAIWPYYLGVSLR